MNVAASSASIAAADGCPAAREAAAGRPTIDIRAFGARPDDGADDAAALASAIAAAGPDKTLVFAPGRYRFSKPVELADRQTYLGGPGVKLAKAGKGAGFIFSAHGRTGVRIACLAFEGGGVLIDGFTRELAITGNRFNKIYDPAAPFGHESAVFIAGLTDRARIAENDLQDIGMRDGKTGSSHGNGIHAYHLNNTVIERNTFQRVHQAISLVFEGEAGSGLGVVVRGNRVRDAFRMGIEAQGSGTSGARFENNEVTLRERSDETIGLSIVINEGEGTVIQGNRVVSKIPADAPCAGFGIEAAGVATRVSGNQVAGNWCAAIGVHADEVQYSIVSGNRICGHGSPYPAIDFYNGMANSRAQKNEITASCNGDLTRLDALGTR